MAYTNNGDTKMLELINKVREFKKSQLDAAIALKKAGAPIDQINKRKVRAANAVSLLESYICFLNMSKDNAFGQKAEHDKYAQDYLSKLENLMVAI